MSIFLILVVLIGFSIILWNIANIYSQIKRSKIILENTRMKYLLIDLASHINCARSEENANEVFCGGCYIALDHAISWLDFNVKDWNNLHLYKA